MTNEHHLSLMSDEDLAAIKDACGELPSEERNLPDQCRRTAYENLPPDEKAIIDKQVKRLCEFNHIGPQSALEIIDAVGRFLR